MINGQMRGTRVDGFLHTTYAVLSALAWQCIHEINIHPFNCLQCCLQGLTSLIGIVDTANFFKHCIIKALYPDGKSIDAGLRIASKTLCFAGTRISLHGDFGIGIKHDIGSYQAKNLVDKLRTHQAGRSATKENTLHRASPDFGQCLLKISLERLKEGLLREDIRSDMGIKITIGAATYTPRQMDINA